MLPIPPLTFVSVSGSESGYGESYSNSTEVGMFICFKLSHFCDNFSDELKSMKDRPIALTDFSVDRLY